MEAEQPQAGDDQKKPTDDLFHHFQLAYDYLNLSLFSDRLPDCILSFATHGRSKGYFTAGRWTTCDQQISAHEISLNPVLLDASTEEIMVWLARLMTHVWQQEYGDFPPNNKGYYNREFTLKLSAIGIEASVDGTPDGKRTGFKMLHWLEASSKFHTVLKDMPERYFFPWKGEQPERSTKQRNKQIYACSNCNLRVETPSYAHLTCNTQACDQVMELISEESTDEREKA